MYEVNEKELQNFCNMQDDYRWFMTDKDLKEYFSDPFEKWANDMELERQKSSEQEAYLTKIGVL